MRAVFAEAPGGPEVLVLREVDDPTPGPGQTLVQVKAAGLNRADLMQMAGKYPPPPGESNILGLEAAGIDLQTGKRVCCLLGSGGLAEKVAVDKRLLLELPDALDFPSAAAIPEVWLTAFLNVFIEGQLAKHERLLVHAAASGVGTAAVQLGRRHGARVIATTRSAAKLDRITALGAHRVIDSSQGFALDEPVDVILDVLGGGPALMQNLNALAVCGRLVMIAMMQGAKAEIDLRVLLGKRLRIIGSTLRSRSVDEKARIVERFKEEVWPGFSSGELKPVIDATFPMTRAKDAAARLASNETVGKVVVTW